MNRRKAMKIAAGSIAAGGAGFFTLSNAFEPTFKPQEEPYQLDNKNAETTWRYCKLDPDVSADVAYKKYDEGSCMYAAFTSVAFQLAEKFGEPYSSFPFHMMKYGHGGVGGFGTICGALNGAAALIGFFVADKRYRIVSWRICFDGTKIRNYRNINR